MLKTPRLQSRQLSAIMLSAALLVALSGCSKDSAPVPDLLSPTSQPGSSQPVAVSAAPQSPAEQVQAQVEQTANAFNQTPQYQLTPEDLALLEAQGVLEAEEAQALVALAKPPQ